jgi:hypothetical protein
MQVPVDNMTWLTWAHVVNLRVLPHRDKQDAVHGWVGMTPLGEYGGEVPWSMDKTHQTDFVPPLSLHPPGGDLVLQDFHLRLQYRPGDVCLFRSAIIEHAVAPFHGDRTAIVLFTHERDLELGKATMDPKIQASLDKLGES